MDRVTLRDIESLTDSLDSMLLQVANSHALEFAEIQRKVGNQAIIHHTHAMALAKSRLRVFQERYSADQYIKPDFDVVEMTFGQHGRVVLRYLNIGLNASAVADLVKVSTMFSTSAHLPAAIGNDQWALKTFLEETASKFWMVQDPAQGGIWCWFASPARAIVQEYAHHDMYDGEEWATMRELYSKRGRKLEHAPSLYVNLWDSSTQFTPWSPPQ